jgi:hypothetical protein
MHKNGFPLVYSSISKVFPSVSISPTSQMAGVYDLADISKALLMLPRLNAHASKRFTGMFLFGHFRNSSVPRWR